MLNWRIVFIQSEHVNFNLKLWNSEKFTPFEKYKVTIFPVSLDILWILLEQKNTLSSSIQKCSSLFHNLSPTSHFASSSLLHIEVLVISVHVAFFQRTSEILSCFLLQRHWNTALQKTKERKREVGEGRLRLKEVTFSLKVPHRKSSPAIVAQLAPSANRISGKYFEGRGECPLRFVQVEKSGWLWPNFITGIPWRE